MNILAFETASSVCGVALFIDGKMVCKDEINKFKIHGQRLPIKSTYFSPKLPTGLVINQLI